MTGDEAVDRTCNRVRDLEAALKDLIDESLQRDNRGPPARSTERDRGAPAGGAACHWGGGG